MHAIMPENDTVVKYHDCHTSTPARVCRCILKQPVHQTRKREGADTLDVGMAVVSKDTC